MCIRDRNQDGYFNDGDEKYDMGSVTNSTGIDTIQTTGTLSVPSSALVGLTTMRVIKNYFEYTLSPCGISSGYGQTEDYKLNVSSNPTGIDHINSTSIRIYPNPVNDVLNISNSENISSVSIYNMLGQEVLFSKMNTSSGQINVSALPKGIYLVKALVGTTINSFKISKQ